MNFCSDNAQGIAPEILAAIEATNEGSARAYGSDALSETVTKKIAALFEREAEVFLIGTGTASNALALSVMSPPHGGIFCHREAHIEVDECGAALFYTGGAKLVLLDGSHAKIDPKAFEAALDALDPAQHYIQPKAISLSQLSEAGTAYSIDEIRTLSDLAHKHGLTVHMDGARFANALVSLGCSPAEMTWKAGVDVLSFGATKNGAMGAEAVVVFNPDLAGEMGYRRKRGGHLFSKMRFVACQLDAYLENDLWLKMATHANQTAARLAEGLAAIEAVSLLHPADGNMMLAAMPKSLATAIKADGFDFYEWPGETPDTTKARLVTAFNTKSQDVDGFLASARRHEGG